MKNIFILILLPVISYGQETQRGDTILTPISEYKRQTIRIIQIKNERDLCYALDTIRQQQIDVLNSEIRNWKQIDVINKSNLMVMQTKINEHSAATLDERRKKRNWRIVALSAIGVLIFENYILMR